MSEKPAPLLDKTSLTFIAFIACPLLGLITAIMGVVFIVTGKTILGIVFLVLITQVFILGGLWALRRRQSLIEDTSGQ